jgi:hypothetical protein
MTASFRIFSHFCHHIIRYCITRATNSVIKYITNKWHSVCYFVVTRLHDLQVLKNDMLRSGSLRTCDIDDMRAAVCEERPVKRRAFVYAY